MSYILEPVRVSQRKPETRIDVASGKRCETARHRNESCHLADSSHDDPAEKSHKGIRNHDGSGAGFDERTTCTNNQASSDSTALKAIVSAGDLVDRVIEHTDSNHRYLASLETTMKGLLWVIWNLQRAFCSIGR